MSAPSSSGRWNIGVAKTLSTTTRAPASCASVATASMSTSSSIGLEGVSRNTACAPSASASRHWSRSAPSTKRQSIPKRGRISPTMILQEPNSARQATTRSPAVSWQASAAKTAAMPLAVPRQASAPSSRARRSSNTPTVGLP